ncbi:MAG: isocitrate lyase/PEP mutase family protein [Clostridia bacterium]|nr:isocitrate lyase/PEP mutase family protein [Clostridia bacterium]
MKMLETKKTSFMDLLKQGQMVFAPCIWDCYSAKAAEMSGFKAALLAGTPAAASLTGTPDLGLMTADELIYLTERVASFSSIPILVDFDEGYGDSPLNTYRNVTRLVNAGAQGFTLDDGMGIRGCTRMSRAKNGEHPYELVSREHFAAKIRAALEAIKGTDCVLIARTEVRINEGFEEAIYRMKMAEDLGAHMTMINNVRGIEEARHVAETCKGWKMYPDIVSHNGKTDADLDELLKLNFNFVTMHFFEKASIAAMIRHGRENFKNSNTVYSDTFDTGLTPEERAEISGMNGQKWLDWEKSFYEGK